MNLTKEIIKRINDKKLFYPGDITFLDDSSEIITGCCFCVNEFVDAYKNIKNCNEVWMGHDPDIAVNYDNNNIIILEPSELECNEIIYSKDEIKKLFIEANNSFEEFIDVFYVYLKNNYPDISNLIYKDLKDIFIKCNEILLDLY